MGRFWYMTRKSGGIHQGNNNNHLSRRYNIDCHPNKKASRHTPKGVCICSPDWTWFEPFGRTVAVLNDLNIAYKGLDSLRATVRDLFPNGIELVHKELPFSLDFSELLTNGSAIEGALNVPSE